MTEDIVMAMTTRHGSGKDGRNTETQWEQVLLRDRNARGELHSYITLLPDVLFYAVFAAVVGAYIVMGGMSAAAVNEGLRAAQELAGSKMGGITGGLGGGIPGLGG